MLLKMSEVLRCLTIECVYSIDVIEYLLRYRACSRYLGYIREQNIKISTLVGFSF